MTRLGKLLDRFAQALELVLALVFMSLFVVTMLNIVLRNVGGVTWLWIPGMMRLLFIWLVFLGIAAGYRRQEHLIVDFFLMRFAERRRTAVMLAIQAALVPFFAMLFVYGVEVARVRMRISFETWQVPTGYAYLAVPVSAVLLLAFAFERLVTLWTELRKP